MTIKLIIPMTTLADIKTVEVSLPIASQDGGNVVGADQEYDKGAEVEPKVTKQAIDQLIGDIQVNEWYCLQRDSESELNDWEKSLIVTGLRKLLSDADLKGES